MLLRLADKLENKPMQSTGKSMLVRFTVLTRSVLILMNPMVEKSKNQGFVLRNLLGDQVGREGGSGVVVVGYL